MSRGFRSKANKERDLALEAMRVRYLSAIAWRRAAWLAEQHADTDIVAADRAEQGLAVTGLFGWIPDQMECMAERMWGMPRVLERAQKMPTFTSHHEGNKAIA